MLALLFRGVFLVGVIGWYSVSLWKTVDNYFKSQFQRYLEEEYQRNPRMRDDVRAYTTTTVDNVASDVIAKTQQQCAGDVCSIDKADLAAVAREVKSHHRDADESVPGDFGAGAAEIEVARPSEPPHTEQPAFRDSPVDEAVAPLDELHQEIPSSAPTAIRINESPILDETKQLAERTPAAKQKRPRKVEKESSKEEKQPSPRARKKARAKTRPKIDEKSEVVTKSKIKRRQKVPTLKLLEDDDFEEADRFFEFDYEDGDRDFADNFEDDDDEDFRGISLKDLPFKPMIDVYDLQRVSEEEYCPLSLDDDPTCDQLQSWP